MKNSIFLLFALAFFFTGKAQIVNIPDPALKSLLLQYEPVIDTNHDNEIQVSEALVVTSLSLNNYYYSFIENLTGIEAFTNLISLDMNYVGGAGFNPNPLTHLQNLDCNDVLFSGSLDLSGLVNLRNVNVTHSNLTSLNLNGLVNLQTLTCDQNHITTLDLTGLNNLRNLSCQGTALTTLNLTGLNNLLTVNCSNDSYMTSLITTGANSITDLNCSGNNLSSLIVTNMTNLNSLDCSYQNISNLDLTGLTSLSYLECSQNNLNSLDVGHLTSLTTLSCSGNNLTSLNVVPLVNLRYLTCDMNQLTTLNVAPLIYLTGLSCQLNLLSNLDVHTLTHLNRLDFSFNNISSIDLSNCTELLELYCSVNQLLTLSVSNLTHLQHLSCYSNQLTSLDVTNLHELEEIRAGENLFTTLDLSQNGRIYAMGAFMNDCPNLTYVNGKNGAYGMMYELYGFDVTNCPNLQNICVNEADISYMTQKITEGRFGTTPTNVQVNSYCTFAPGGIYNVINGTATMDINHNGCGEGDYHPADFKVKINDGSTDGATFSSATGNYSFYSQVGSYVLTPQLSDSPYFTITPATSTLTFNSLDGSTQTQNYCITAIGIHPDVEITLIPRIPARPGFDSSYCIIFKNKGTEVLSGTVNLLFDDSIFDFVSSNPTLSSQSTNSLNWNYSNLMPFESRKICFVLNLNSPVESPAVNNGDLLYFTASVNPTDQDETPQDNVFHFTQVVNGSYDPNDKTCLEGSTMTPESVGDYLNYIIRFQNSGTYYAENVVVKDVIDTSKFDVSSLQLVSSSHPHTTRINGNKVEFIFENINLPAEMDDEPGSQGFVAFKVKTLNNLVLGDQVQNTADIYFDFNAPIVTNTTSTTVAILNISETEVSNITISPIPVKDILQVNALETISSVELFDIQGHLLQVKTSDSLTAAIDFSGRPKGVYLVKVHTLKGMKVQKVIKE